MSSPNRQLFRVTAKELNFNHRDRHNEAPGGGLSDEPIQRAPPMLMTDPVDANAGKSD
jgi:hypothetical protein